MVDLRDKSYYTGFEVGDTMKLTVKKEPLLEDDYVDIRYRELTTSINQIIEICNQSSQMLLGEMDNKKHPIDISDILYIEWVDGRACICTADNVFTSVQTLSQLEQSLSDKYFVRVSKPMLLNICKVKWVSSMLNMKLMAELTNGERVSISRHYRNDMLNKIYEMGREIQK